MSFKSLYVCFLWYQYLFLKPLFSALDLKSHRDRYMHPMRSKGWEQSDLGFPTSGIRDLG